jgi:hypothetical protein
MGKSFFKKPNNEKMIMLLLLTGFSVMVAFGACKRTGDCDPEIARAMAPVDQEGADAMMGIGVVCLFVTLLVAFGMMEFKDMSKMMMK